MIMDSVFQLRLFSCCHWFLLLITLFTSPGRACFFQLNNTQGELAPPLYPQVNLVITQCTWKLPAPVGQVVEITFEEVQFDNSTDEDGNCVDGTKLFSGESSEIIPPFCGEGPPWPRLPIRLLSETNLMTVTMEKTLEGSRGFRASYKHVPPREEFIACIAVEEPAIIMNNRLGRLEPIQKIPLLSSREPSALSFDPIESKFYFTDIQAKFIGRIGLGGSVVDKLVEENIENPLGLTVAHLTGLLYWTDADRHEVSVSRLDGSFRKTLLSSSSDCRTPKGIAVSKDNLNIFWTCERGIQKSNADGSDRNPTFVSVDVVNPTAVTIDPTGFYLFWLDTHLEVVERVRVDGVGRVEHLSSSSDFFQHLHSLVLDDFAYFVTNTDDQKLHIIERFAAKPRGRTFTVIPPNTFRGLYHHKSDTVITERHACGTNNGGCNELCLPNGDLLICSDVTPRIYNCPNDIVKISSSPFETITWLEPTAISRSSDQTTSVAYQSRSHAPTSVLIQGTTKVVYVFEDDLGNEAQCAFNVTVQPNPIASTKITPSSPTTIVPATSTKITKSVHSTTEAPNSSNDFSEYIIIGLILLVLCLVVAVIVIVLCSCGCFKCDCRMKERRPTTDPAIPMKNEVVPMANIDQHYAMGNIPYLTAAPYVAKDEDYFTVIG